MAKPPSHPTGLDRYRAKRSAGATTEPFGKAGNVPTYPPGRPRMFVVHKHAARNLHWDLRLEMDGVLRSWAVPRGPSLDPADKRLAVLVEDHPLEYGDFEGVIPDGNYGAGPSIVWDRGGWTPVGDPAEGLAHGKLLFDLAGYKLRGRWTLVKLQKDPKGWLLIKERHEADGSRCGEPTPLAEESVLSGFDVGELGSAAKRAATLRAELAAAGAPEQAVPPGLTLMQAETADQPFSREGWVFELKYDGFRLLASRLSGAARLRYRSGNDATHLYPEIAAALAALPYSLMLDGEVVVLDAQSRPSFQRLQNRALVHSPREVARAQLELPATLFAFDLIAFEGLDLRPLPLLVRKAALERLLPRAGPIRYSDHIETRGAEMYEEVRTLGLEGLIAKKADAPYRAGRSGEWLKMKAERTGDFAVVGFPAPDTEGARRRGHAISLHLAAREGDGWVYTGRVGSGLSEAAYDELRERLRPDECPKPPCTGMVPTGRGHVWVAPRVVVEVRYLESTNEGLLRHPVFLRERDDKRPEECLREPPARDPAQLDEEPASAASASASPAPASATEAPAAEARKVVLSNLGKLFWRAEGYSKGDLIEFYRGVAPWLLPYLRDRPLVLTRFPDGIAGKSFYQQDAPAFAPAWLRRERIWSGDAARDIDHFVADDVESLVYIANMAAIPLHVWASRAGSLAQPDWCVLDLDPKGAPFADVLTLLGELRAVCDQLGLPGYPKTSGQQGMHLMIPLGGQLTHEQSRMLAELIARLVEKRHPGIATTARAVSARGGKVYLDFGQNGHGKTIVTAYSVRAAPGATVSTPLTWDEVGPGLDPTAFTIKTVLPRLARRGDPMAPLLTDKPDLVSALARLAELVGPAAPGPTPAARRRARKP